MSLIKKNFWLIAIILTLVLVGCKSEPVDENVFQDTYDKMSQQTNYKVEMNINVGYGEDINTTSMVFGFDLESRTQGVVKVDTTLLGIEHEGYREFKETEVLSYTNVAGTANWIKKTMSMDDFNNSEIDSDNYFTIITHLSDDNFVKEVTLDETKYDVYTVKLNKPEILDDVFTANNQKLLHQVYALSEKDFDAYFNEVTYEITLDTENKLVKSIKTDLSPIFVKLAADYQANKGKAPSFTHDEVSLEMVFSNFNTVEVSIPENVKTIAIAR
ncbi:MAG: hypothetical protein K0Q49_284 [Haloplasmataceae bacterium]|jgi:hypothetical protein|nr:hypothetical protein [Haloplasmataceae bacterium]